MTSIHLLCRDRANLHRVDPDVYESGDWDLPEKEAQSLVGGTLFLHQSKAKRSYFGGMIEKYRIATVAKTELQRVVFTVRADAAAKEKVWRGGNHARAWTGGVVTDDQKVEQKATP
jgi:hypothetical protein